MPTILFYTSIKTRVRDQESLMVEFVKQGHKVFFLNQQANEYLPAICERAGVVYETVLLRKNKSTIVHIFSLCVQLIRYIRNNKIDVVYSHLEPANFIAVLIQYFVRAKVIIVRHHHDLAARAGFHKDLSYRLTYKLAKDIITVSNATRKYMIAQEQVAEEKIHHINLGYDFAIFGKVNAENVKTIKTKFPGHLIFVTVGRLDNYKRPSLSIEVLKKLVSEDIPSHLFLLGSGDQKSELENLVNEYNLREHVDFLGYQDNVLDYLQAADWLLHPSSSESSCVVVKEAGLVELPVIVCRGVGDFNDYLVHEENAVLIDENDFPEQAVGEIKKFGINTSQKDSLGKKLKEVVINRFGIHSVVNEYKKFHN